MPTREIIQVPSSDSPPGPPLWASVTLPVGYNPQRRYPILVYIYGGPDSQTVSTRHTLSTLYVSQTEAVLTFVSL